MLALSRWAGLTAGLAAQGTLGLGHRHGITVIGADPSWRCRASPLGSDFLPRGFRSFPILIGIFAFAQIVADVEKMGRRDRRGPRPIANPTSVGVSREGHRRDPVAPFAISSGPPHRAPHRRSPAIGGSRQYHGLRPGEKVLRHPERFGNRHPEGIIASESSEHSNVAGRWVTIMAFGIPGDAVTAVMLGAMIIHGIQPGPPSSSPGAPDCLRFRRLSARASDRV